MAFRWRPRRTRSTPDRPRGVFRPSGEVLEGRALLAAALTHQPAAALRHARVAERAAYHREQVAAYNAAHPDDPQSLDNRYHFAVNTVQTGQKLAGSSDVRKTGVDYAKLGVAHDTRKVGLAYLKAAFRGDGKDIQRLGKTKLVTKVGHDFTALSHSPAVKKVGDAFASFGRAVARQFDRVF